jgi:dsDNA-specific endonuclease/ATPase MutS2
LFPRDLLDIRGTLISVRSMKILLSRFAAEYPLLGDRAAQLQPLGHIIDAIGRCLDDEGRVLDSASPSWRTFAARASSCATA